MRHGFLNISFAASVWTRAAVLPVLFFVSSGAVSAQPSSAWLYPPEIPDAELHVYKTVGDVRLNAWVLHGKDQPGADTTSSRPAVVFFFGGGWKGGTPMQFILQARYLQTRGITSVLCDYRVASRQDVKAVDCVEDAKSAIRWVRSHAADLHVNPERICAAGGSAGGHTACCTSLLQEFDAAAEDGAVSSVPNAMALYNPAVMLAPLADVDVPDAESTRFEELKPRLGVESERISPIHHVRAGLPPTIIFHGEADPTVPFATVDEFTRRMTAAGNRCELHGFAGAPHGFFNWREASFANPKDDVARDDRYQWHQRTTLQLDLFLQSLGWIHAGETVPIVDNDHVRVRGTLTNSRDVFQKTGKGHVAFLGGSITEMDGYRPRVCDWLQKTYPDTQFTFTNAGIASTCSTTGACRFRRDVLEHGPVDLLLVEFAVNDDQDAMHDAESCVRGMEGIIQQLRAHNPLADALMVHFVNPGMVKTIQAGEEPLSSQQHERVARQYGISSVYLSREVAQRIDDQTLTWEQFGGTHPGTIGNQLAADLVTDALSAGWLNAANDGPVAHEMPNAPLLKSSFSKAHLMPHSIVKDKTGWHQGVPDWENIPGSKRSRFADEELLFSETVGATLAFEFRGRAVGAFVLAGPDAGRLDYRIDGGDWHTTELYHHYSRGLHYPRTVMFESDLPDGVHHIDVRISAEHHLNSNGTAARVLSFVANGS